MTQFTIDTALNLVQSSEQFPVNFDDAWQWLEFSNKGNAKRSFDKTDFIENTDYVVLLPTDKADNHNSLSPQEKAILQNTRNIRLTVDCFKSWAMMVNTERGKQVRQYFLECERQLKSQQKEYTLPKTYLEALKALVAGVKINAIQSALPSLATHIEPARQLLINSTAKENKLLTPTQLGQLMTPPKKPTEVNQLLISNGYQTKNINKKGQKDLTYLPTDKAKDHCSITLATGTNNSTTYQQLRWYDSILTLI